jgi:hypothetical protein
MTRKLALSATVAVLWMLVAAPSSAQSEAPAAVGKKLPPEPIKAKDTSKVLPEGPRKDDSAKPPPMPPTGTQNARSFGNTDPAIRQPGAATAETKKAEAGK